MFNFPEKIYFNLWNITLLMRKDPFLLERFIFSWEWHQDSRNTEDTFDIYLSLLDVNPLEYCFKRIRYFILFLIELKFKNFPSLKKIDKRIIFILRAPFLLIWLGRSNYSLPPLTNCSKDDCINELFEKWLNKITVANLS